MKIFHNYEERKARTPRAHFVRLRTLATSEKIRENTRCGGRGKGWGKGETYRRGERICRDPVGDKKGIREEIDRMRRKIEG